MPLTLKKIKLAGFKSFVDPTIVSLPSSLVAIVGPNGCGKSNIIDAVCWVMGESSAKYLRGESLTDVIFNGSSARKPVGQASVELIFDNQGGVLGGEYASYAEISIKRSISREGDSSYFLNNSRCRRKDIIDIFLGTGLGPRSYSIIGQNMISRLIEAKPDEMRVYLEEAAGISKYKERRRETENRIQHTKENLARLNDIRTELEKQLGNLKRQASAAEKFKILKQDERNLRAQWLVIQWRDLDGRMVQYTLQVQQQETGLEAHHAELSDLDRCLEIKREEQRTAAEVFQEVQRRYYSAGNEINRIEQEIRHHQERDRQWQTDVAQVDKDWQEVKDSLEESENELKDLTQEIHQLTPEMETTTVAAKDGQQELHRAEQAVQNWQGQWDEFNQQAANSTQTAQVEQTRIQHFEQRIESIKQRQVKLDQEQSQINFTQLDQEIEEISQQIDKTAQDSQNQQQQLNQTKEKITSVQSKQQDLTKQLDQVRNELQKMRGQQASLEALQQTALGQRNNRISQWLSKHNLDKKMRLAQGVEVESGWENAVEKVLGINLQAICVEEIKDIVSVLDQLKEGTLAVFSTQPKASASNPNATTLLSKIKSKWPLDSLLNNIYTADSLDAAMNLAGTLAVHESVITREGVWLSPAWLRVSREENPAAGVFQREQELKQLAQKIAERVAKHDALEKEISENKDQLITLEKQRDEFQKSANQCHARHAEVNAQKKVKQERITELKNRAERLRQEKDESIIQLKDLQTQLTAARNKWQEAMHALEQHATKRETLTTQRDQLRDALQKCRDTLHQARENAHQVEIRLQTTKSQHAACQQAINRLQSQLSALTERKTALQAERLSGDFLENLQKELSSALTLRLSVEEELNKAKTNMTVVEQDARALEIKRQDIEKEANKVRDALEHLRVEWQGLKVKSETLSEQIRETGFLLEDILKGIPPEATAQEWHSQLEQIMQRISRLGAINLVAIEEFASCSERKEYLDKQHDDLQEGLTTLENAISKIDKETRARFKETFDKVNDRFQELFPRIFGGGRAYLELTGENLLDAGISVMACPPGKRNSTIHLLSGGEKAMTAIALVFSIFHLNPAPFCLLDEVDAPLDDANIGRFCQLVKAMSDKTQFIFISHNKLAIEMAEHLMGVTMHEPGVSRLVTVNVEEAVSLAGA